MLAEVGACRRLRSFAPDALLNSRRTWNSGFCRWKSREESVDEHNV